MMEITFSKDDHDCYFTQFVHVTATTVSSLMISDVLLHN